MERMTTAIDTLYDAMMRVTVRFLIGCIELYAFPVSHSESRKEHAMDVRGAFSSEAVDEPVTFKTVEHILSESTPLNDTVQKNTVMYANTLRVPVYQHPTIEFDAQIGEVPYGEMVIIFEPKGRFYRIMWREIEGWVLKDDIADRAARVLPAFIVGDENPVDAVNTSHVRAIIQDTFGLGRSEFPLQAGEYILYRLWKRGVSLLWPSVRPRVPGSWHNILRGRDGVHIMVSPKVGSIMEYFMDHELGHLAYVEAVYPDGTITISEVNYPDRGVYSERELVLEEWKALKPLFIEVE